MTAYGPSPVNRQRRTRAELDTVDEAIIAAVAADSPVTLRGVFYRAVSAGAVEKTELGYRHDYRGDPEVTDATVTPLPVCVLANIAFERAASHPSRSPGRRAAAAACEALRCSTTADRARRRLQALRDPDLRADALALLDELEQLGGATEGGR